MAVCSWGLGVGWRRAGPSADPRCLVASICSFTPIGAVFGGADGSGGRGGFSDAPLPLVGRVPYGGGFSEAFEVCRDLVKINDFVIGKNTFLMRF